jgi:hypothetical protein
LNIPEIQAQNNKKTQERIEVMGKHKKNSRAKSSLTISDPHFTEYDIQKERNIQDLNSQNKPSHS